MYGECRSAFTPRLRVLLCKDSFRVIPADTGKFVELVP
jgi:hypothetical protein